MLGAAAQHSFVHAHDAIAPSKKGQLAASTVTAIQCFPGCLVYMLQSDIEGASPNASGSSEYDSVSSGDVAEQQGEGGDPTVRAQEIIGRAVRELRICSVCTVTACAAVHTWLVAALPRC